MKKWYAAGIAVLLIGMLGACSNQSDDAAKQPDNDKKEVQDNDNTMEDSDQSAEQSDPDQGSGNTSDETDEIGENNTGSLTQREVIQAVKNQLSTDLDIKLPKQLPLKEGKHLTATTSSAGDHYQITFYSSAEPIPINHETLNGANKQAKPIAVLKVKKYPNRDKANQAIGFQDFSNNGAHKVDLGHGITGYQDAGAGHARTNWN
ncbi:hypothetical protein CFK37_00065 [Virgibacillus phasianinus]|uniref:Lipoprotein n=1 Tax=Virgibacillus phasianinus TaxID=2017483 RepID=A0A220TY84_9BACI|nr:hypothetical protein [Virgibacillus phasianinus]ASK60715.1 hypothetical protein CFK37_00065 [Virgibacillus phasianinus]